jgi:outer membrane protein TolC
MKAVLVLVALAGVAHGEERVPVTLAGALAAVDTAPGAAPLAAELAAARASIDAARALPNPSVRVGTTRLTHVVAAGASMPLPIFGTLGAARGRAKADADLVRDEATIELRQLRHRVAKAWIELARADAQLVAATLATQHAAELELIARGRKDAGTGAEVDITIAQAAKARADLEAAAAARGLDAASADLAGLLGWPPDRPLRAEGPLVIGDAQSLDAVKAKLLVHPERVAAQARVAVAASTVREVRAEGRPQLALEAELLYDDRSMTEGRTAWARTDATIGIAIDIPLFAHVGDRLRAARAREAVERARVVAKDAELGAGLFATYRRWQAATERVTAMENSVLPAQERGAAMSVQAFREGARDLSFALQAQRDLAVVRAELAAARADAAVALVDLQAAAGTEVGVAH